MVRQSSPDLFAEALPEGLLYRENAVGGVQAEALVSEITRLPFKPFEFHGYLGNRRVVSYGWRYDYAGRALRESAPIPAFLLDLRVIAGELAGLAPEQF